MVRTHTLQGTFGDPYYGGNANFVGWDLIGFPGLRLNVSAEDQRLGAKLTPTHRSAYDHDMFTKASASSREPDASGAVCAFCGPRESRWPMATRLKDTDVVVVGLGAAGGVAVLPLTQAGIDVVGLEAGTWLTKRDFAPDELRNNVRDWPMAVQKAQQEVPTHRVNAKANTTRAGSHPMMNAVGGTTLHYWAQSWRLNPWDFKVVSETTKRYGASRVPKGSTVEDWPFGLEELEPYYDKVEYEMRRVGTGRQHQGHDRSARQHLRRPAQSRLPDAAAAQHRLHRPDDVGGARPRLESVSRARPRSTRAPTRADRRACITASATRAAVTSTRRTART